MAAPARPRPTSRGEQATIARLRSLGIDAWALNLPYAEELQRLTADLDRFVAYGYDTATQRRFLHSPHPALRFSTPAQAMQASADGVRRARAALLQTLTALAKTS
jgi:hypothetical protein